MSPPKRLLMGPGPSNLDEDVFAALAEPLVSHLDVYFIELMEQTKDLLRKLFGTASYHTIPISGTGSAGLETIMFNLVEPGESVVVGEIGYFGDRLAQMARRAGADVRVVRAEWGDVLSAEQIEEELRNAPAQLVALVHAETSTGACQPLQDIIRVAHEHGALVAVDCVTSLGGMPVLIDEWGIDAAGSCSQKCIGAPPGLGPVTFGQQAMEKVGKRKKRGSVPRTWYFDLNLLFEYWGRGESTKKRAFHHTAPVSSIYAFHRALKLIAEETLEERFSRHEKAHRVLVSGLEELGLEVFTSPEHRLPMLIVIKIPDKLKKLEKSIPDRLLEVSVAIDGEEFQGIEIAGGLGQKAGEVWRIGLMGVNADVKRVETLLGAVGEALSAEGW